MKAVPLLRWWMEAIQIDRITGASATVCLSDGSPIPIFAL